MNRNLQQCVSNCQNVGTLWGTFGDIWMQENCQAPVTLPDGTSYCEDEVPWYFQNYTNECVALCNIYGSWANVPESEKPQLIFGMTQQQLLLIAGAFLAIKSFK